MQVAHANNNLLQDNSRIVLVEIVVLLDELEQVAAIDQLCNNVDMCFGLDALLELQQQWMRNYLHHAAFVSIIDTLIRDQLTGLWIQLESLNHFDRVLLALGITAAFVYHREFASADLLADFVLLLY